MGIFTITGTVVAIGQSMFDNRDTLYAFVEIVEPNGRRVLVQNVAVGNEVLAALNLGSKGEFFFDKILVVDGPGFVSQLWGVKAHEGLVAFDNANLRIHVVFKNLIVGLIGSLLVIGIPLFIFGLIQSVPLILQAGKRKQLFFWSDRAVTKRLRQQQTARI